jgi:cell division protein FtsL
VIYIAWMNRQINTEIQELRNTKDKLKIEWRHMLLEHNALSEHSRIERIASKKLKMTRPDIKTNEKIISENE